MGSLIPRSSKRLAISLLIVMIAAGCSPQASATQPPLSTPVSATAIPATAVADSPTATPSPAPAPTGTPGAAPIPGPAGYLLTRKDLPDVFTEPAYSEESYTKGSHAYMVFYLTNGIQESYRMMNTITIATQPWTKIPEESSNGLKPIEAPVVGQGSQAYQDDGNTLVNLVFFKGRALVSIMESGFDLDTVVNLGKLIEARLPEDLPGPSPITFPEKMDTTGFSKYFKSIHLGTLNQATDTVDPKTVFSAQNQETVCWDFESIPGAKRSNTLAFAVYDVQNNIYVYERRAGVGLGGQCIYGLVPGKYEFRLSLDEILSASLPFEIQ